ncbi:MAG: hypothetical protein MUO85_09310 [candidate division Zixibacteria bacterium]|nr:hypothetical protein [candidate division Zixibacteria bacterium]
MVAQIVFIREMLVVFGGNELCLGVLLFVWFLWVGVGSFAGNRITGDHAVRQAHRPEQSRREGRPYEIHKIYPNQNNSGQTTNDEQKATLRVAHPKNIFSLKYLFLWYIITAVLCFLTIFLIRSSKLILGLNTIEIVGFIPMMISSFILLAPFCFLLGFVFVLNSKVWQFSDISGFLVNRVYLWESIGAGLGGVLTTFVFISKLSNFDIIQIIVLLNILLGIILLAKYVSKFKLALTSFLFLVIIFMLIGYQSKLEKISLKLLWRDLPLVKTEDTKYGNIAILKDKEQVSFYENGLLLFSYPAPFSSEEAVHFALSEHSNPQKLLLIGGGLGGGLAEALKYDKLKIDYVELDNRLIGLAKEYLPSKEADLFSNPRLNLHLIDGRLFVKNPAGKEKYDVIILNLPDPSTLQLNRFYTIEFFNSIKKILDENGIFSFRVSSAENYISPEQGLYLSSLYRSLSSVFKKVIVLPGDNNIFLASDRENLFYDWSKITARLKERSIRTEYINQNFLPFRLSQFRIEYLRDAINKSLGRINYDLEPISFFYNIILWSAQFKSIEKPAFLFLYQLNRWWVFSILLGIWLIFLFYSLLRKEKSISLLTLSAIFITGATSIFLEIIILLSFQVFYGYLYSKVGLILTLFMLGLGTGALYMQNRIKRRDVSFGNLALIQLYQLLLVFALLCLIVYFSISLIDGYSVELALYLAISFCGMIGGAEFVLANHLYLKEGREGKVGMGYSVDLWGSAASSILASVILIPIVGVITVMIIFLLADFILFIALIFKARLKII